MRGMLGELTVTVTEQERDSHSFLQCTFLQNRGSPHLAAAEARLARRLALDGCQGCTTQHAAANLGCPAAVQAPDTRRVAGEAHDLAQNLA